MPNINKVVYGNTTLIDLTDTTATASDVASGKYFYGKDGVKTEGTASGGGGVISIVETPDAHGGTVIEINATVQNDVQVDQNGSIILPTTQGGGSSDVHSASGDITVVSDIVVSAGGTPSAVFPGLQLPFIPDFLWLWQDPTDYQTNGVAFSPFVMAVKKFPNVLPFRHSASLTSYSTYANRTHLFFSTTNRSTSTDPAYPGGYCVTTFVCMNLDVSPGWNMNNDGTITVSTNNGGADNTIKAGTWHYQALKG